MYLVFSEKPDEYTRIKATLGSSCERVRDRNSLIDVLDQEPTSQVVVVAPSIPSEVTYALAEELRITRPWVHIIMVRTRIDLSTLSSALEFGIKDVVDAQDASALITAVHRCETLAEKISARFDDESKSHRGRVITIFSAKGGVGKTTVASNIALALSRSQVGPVCLVDLNLHFGDVSAIFKVEANRTFTDVIALGENFDFTDLEQVLHNYHVNLQLLLAPIDPKHANEIGPELVSKTIAVLRTHFNFIVIDTPPALTEVTTRALNESDLLLLLSTLEMPSIKNLHLTLGALDAIDFPRERRRLLLNRSDLKAGLEQDDVEELLDAAFDGSIPTSAKVSSAINQGRLIIDAYPRDGVSRSLTSIAQLITSSWIASAKADVA